MSENWICIVTSHRGNFLRLVISIYNSFLLFMYATLQFESFCMMKRNEVRFHVRWKSRLIPIRTFTGRSWISEPKVSSYQATLKDMSRFASKTENDDWPTRDCTPDYWRSWYTSPSTLNCTWQMARGAGRRDDAAKGRGARDGTGTPICNSICNSIFNSILNVLLHKIQS